MHVHGARLSIEIEAPHQVEQLFAAQDNSLVFRQHHEQVKFLGA